MIRLQNVLCVTMMSLRIELFLAQVWRQRTEDTILSLTENSAKVADDLQQSAKIQDIIVQNQLQTLEYQVDAKIDLAD